MDMIYYMWRYMVLACLLFLLVFTYGCANNQNNNQQNQIQDTKQKLVYDSLRKDNQILLQKTGYACNIVEEYDTGIYTKDKLQYVFNDMESMGYQVVSVQNVTKTIMLSADPVVYQKDTYVRVIYSKKVCAVVN